MIFFLSNDFLFVNGTDGITSHRVVTHVVGHYENLPMQYTEIFSAVKIENVIRKMLIFFLFLLKT